MSSCLQPSPVCDPSGAGTFCGAWLHIPAMPKIHITAVYAFPKSIGHGFTVHDRLTQHLTNSKYAEKEPIESNMCRNRAYIANILFKDAIHI